MTTTTSTPIRFLVTDVDGTLVDGNKELTPAAIAVVQALRDAHVGFAFVSSRPPRGLAYVADALQLSTHGGDGPAAAAFNGGALLDAHLKPIAFTPLLDDDARIAIDVFAALQVDTWLFTLDEWLLVDPAGHYVAHERHTVGFDHRQVADFGAVTGIGKIVGSSTDPALLERAAQTLAARLSPHAKAALSQTYYLDVTHADANKGAAMRAIADHAGLTLEQMAAIGDMRNDLAMLEIAGFSIAMGNAPDDVKAKADAVTDSNRDEGFAHAVRRLVMPRAVTDQSVTDTVPSRHRRSVEVLPDAASLAARATEWLIEQIAHAVERRGRAVIALSGGSTPRAVFELLAVPPWRDRIAWDKVHLFWGDERFVAADDVASNARMTRVALLDHVDIPAAHLYPMPNDEGASAGDVDATFARAQVAATVYATSMYAFYGSDRLKEDQPFFDVTLLGLGEDGHTASLFPGTPALDERSAWVVAVKTDNATAPVRITMTYPILESAHATLFLVSGTGKQAMAARVLAGDETVPAGRLKPLGGTLWLLDAAAAGRSSQS